MELRGNYQVWNWLGNVREYADITLPFSDFRQICKPVRYNAVSGKGEQRALRKAHAAKLRKEMENGSFTTTQLTAGLYTHHIKALTKDEQEGTFALEVSPEKPLPLTDGQHRADAVAGAIAERETALAALGDDDADRERIQGEIESLNALPIGMRIFFDGNLQADFIRLQAGQSVDASHLLSLKIKQKVLAGPEFKLAFNICKNLNAQKTPFQNLIRFDSAIPEGILRQLPLNTLFQKSSSDLGTSIVGLAKVGLASDMPEKELAAFLTECVVLVADTLSEHAPELATQPGRLLSLPYKGGTKGSATMLVGVAVCFAYRVLANGGDVTDEDTSLLIQCARKTLSTEVSGTFSVSAKRQLIGAFAREYLKGMDEKYHDGLPVKLLQTLSSSAFDAETLPKQKKGDAEFEEAEKQFEGTVSRVEEETPAGEPVEA